MTSAQPVHLRLENLNWPLWGLAILYCLSGLTSLAYEVLWSRMLSMQFGVSIIGVVLTVAAFMIGLGLGSLVGAKWVKHCKNPIVIFGILEIAIASYALVLPSLLRMGSVWLEAISTHLTPGQWYVLQGIEALCLLSIPAFAMGLSFAIVLKAVHRTPISLGKLYGLNTIGGVVGALIPLWSLPVFGWVNSVRMIAAIGLLVGMAALVLSWFSRVSETSTNNKEQVYPPLGSLFIYAGIGAGSIMLEIGWIRLYGMIMLRTEYVLGIILSVFLLGIALGSMMLPRTHKAWMSVLLPCVAGGGVLFSLWFLPTASAWVEQSQFQSQSFAGALWAQLLTLVIFTLPVTLALGAWLPLLAGRFDNSEVSGVWLYGANCLGGAVGAIIACLIFIPFLGTAATVVIAGLVIIALGLIWAKSRVGWLIFMVMLFAAWPLRNMPPVRDLLPKIEAGSQDLYIYEDAISLTHVVRQQDGQRVLLSDLQRMDASTEPSAVEIQKDQARLALLLHSSPRSVLFLGLGTGISMAGSMPFPTLERSAVELSQGSIVAAQHWFAPVNGEIVKEAKIYQDDAKHFISTTSEHYDVIVGDLFHPDIAGMGALLSVQQFQKIRNHLNADGIFVQWVALNQFDIQSLDVVLRSFRKVFPSAQLFMDGMHLALVGPRDDFQGARALLKNLDRLKAQEKSGATGGEEPWTWLGRYWGPIDETTGLVQDEWVPYIEFKLPRTRYDGGINLSNVMLWLLQKRPAPETAMQLLKIDQKEKSQFGGAYVATELAVRAWISFVQGETEKGEGLIWLAHQANPQDRWIANELADSMLQSLGQAAQHGLSEREALHRILGIDPNSVGALRALWQLEKTEKNLQAAEVYRQRLIALSPFDAEAQTVY